MIWAKSWDMPRVHRSRGSVEWDQLIDMKDGYFIMAYSIYSLAELIWKAIPRE